MRSERSSPLVAQHLRRNAYLVGRYEDGQYAVHLKRSDGLHKSIRPTIDVGGIGTGRGKRLEEGMKRFMCRPALLEAVLVTEVRSRDSQPEMYGGD